MHDLYLIILNHARKRHHLAYSAALYHKKTNVKFQPNWFKIFREKVKGVQKCIN